MLENLALKLTVVFAGNNVLYLPYIPSDNISIVFDLQSNTIASLTTLAQLKISFIISAVDSSLTG